MEEPKYTATVTIGGAEGNDTDYETDCMGRRIHADQSFILAYQLVDGNDSGPFDISSATASLFVSAYKNKEFTPVLLSGGVITDSGGGTDDTVTFTVAKDLIPDELSDFPLRNPGNALFYAIIEDADSKIEIVNFVNVYDDSYGLTSEAQPGANTIVPKGNDLGTVTDYLITTPPSPTLNLAYIVAPSSTGDWSGQDGNLAIGNGTSWIFFVTVEGNFAFDANSNMQVLFDGSTWAEDEKPPFTDASALIKNDADPTKLVKFDASAITTATERTVTVPDANVDLGAIATNTAKVTNATHTGEVTGATTLTVDPTAISNKSSVTAAATDTILIGDASDSNNLKKVTAQSIADLGGGGTDADAIHDNVASEISAITNKATVAAGDFILIEDSADSNNKKHILASLLLAGSGDVTAAANIGDNLLVRGDGAGKGVQNSGITIDDSDNFNNNGSGGANNCIGGGAGGSLTTGADNTLIGEDAGNTITTGSNNVGVGVRALNVLLGGVSNMSLGRDSLRSATSASNNGAVGLNALRGITTGDNNVGIGNGAGRFIAGGAVANETGGTGTFLGVNTDASADGNSNETVIGYNAIGNGSNTITLGNSSVTDVFVGADNIQTLVAAGTDNNQTGTTYTLVLADQENTTVWMSNASANECTIPTNASVAFPIGTKINIMMEGAGVTTIAAVSASVTLNGVTDGSHVINNQYQGATLTKRGTDTWILAGDIT